MTAIKLTLLMCLMQAKGRAAAAPAKAAPDAWLPDPEEGDDEVCTAALAWQASSEAPACYGYGREWDACCACACASVVYNTAEHAQPWPRMLQ